MRRAARFAMLSVMVLVSLAYAQDNSAPHRRLTNHDIIAMVQMGLSEDVITAKIREAAASDPGALSFDTSVEGLKALKEAKVPDAVMKVMINPGAAPVAVVAVAAPMTMDPNLPPPEVGVYWKDGAKFVLIQGQALTNMKAGGRAGSFFTDGIRNQHWDSVLEGKTSRNIVSEHRPTFYLYVPDGTDSSDYVLIKLNRKGNRREFQVGSFGGITGGKSGVKRDKELAFKAEHVGIRTYKLALEADLPVGEYGFFMGTGQSNTMAGARGGNRSGGAAGGRIYDFSILE
ncbi:MAG: hypothetical protein ACLP3R_26975 [Candidatus Korobacteraceae bacterium]